MADQQLMIFISYSRADSEFVDRLDADLRARGYRTWVDRRRLEGGVDWEREINAAIAGCDLFLISLSPPAVASPYVQQEFEEGQRLSKRLMPVRYQNYTTPTWFAPAERIQQQDFTSASAYALNLKRLLYAIQDPTLNLSASTDDLYAQTLKLRPTDPERAAIMLQHIVDREPTYFGGQAQRDLADLDTTLYASRVAHLRVQAEQARKDGQYGVEAASLEAIVALGDRDRSTYDWANEFLPIAQQNRAMLGPYSIIQDRIADGDTATARTLLQNLWRQAPYFRDPANIAPTLGLTLPPTYVQDKAAAAEQKRFEEACAILSGDLSKSSLESVHASLQHQRYDLDSTARELIEQVFQSQRRNAMLAAKSKFDGMDGATWPVLAARVVLIAAVVGAPYVVALFMYRVMNVDTPYIGIFGATVAVLILEAPLAAVFFWTLYRYSNVRKALLDFGADAARLQASEAYQQWRTLAENTRQQRIAAINRGETPA